MNDIQLTQEQLNRLETSSLDIEQVKAERIEIEQMYDSLIGKLLSYHSEADKALIRKAFEYAYDKHLLQRRKSGEPYIIHPLGVAKLVTQLKLDEASICAALLHDVVEDTETTHRDIVDEFGLEIANLVDALTKLDKYQFTSKEERQAANFCKMLFAMNSDLRCILIKLADRVHNMRTLQHMRPDKQATIAQETLDIYVPIANRLGIEWMKAELEDICLKYLHPEEYQDLNAKITHLMEDKHDYIERVKGLLNDALVAEGITGFKLKGRVKHIYSIYRKLKRSDGVFENLHDIIAFRVIVNTKAECYHVLGIVHGMWTLVENRFKDYISRPKANQYSSLHTSVIGPDREHFEVQIRTYEMDQIAEEGIAAHWKYKEGNITPAKDARDFEWLRQLVEFHDEAGTSDSNYFLNSVKVDLFNDDVFVFTPNGEIKALPLGSCPIDFAYAVHSEVGDHCSGALVNGNIVSLRYELKTGDVVDIITRANQKPKSDWLQMVATNRAKSKITKFLSQEERNTHKLIGNQLAEKTLKKLHLNLNQFERLPDLPKLLSSLKLQNLEALYVALGSEKLSPETFLEKVQPFTGQVSDAEPESSDNSTISQTFLREERVIEKISKRAQTNVCVDGIDNLAIHFAKCCSPVPGEPIVGFITRGRGLAIHHMNCPRIRNLEPERHVECHWDPKMADATQATRSVNVQVVANDRIGILQDVIKVMSEMKINISQTHCRTLPDSLQCILTFEVQVVDIKQLNMLLRNIQRTPGVITAERSTT
ncbi:MAG: bifunctional (p)ppGpp synthetase/guanosine-3',5'-bis(diphosphate) 3'-pyrophosphohydrolase [Proteobacteria bacterium]|nr:bifunctional (p)ppGpp synthetase/guanosine-3',5'-bis(diphosphate) 3'-pyrophosphohydrolase [Pseudomonadota bacterium]